MFNFFKSFKKIAGFGKKVDDGNSKDTEPKNNIRNKIDKFSYSISHLFSYAIVEYRIIKEKMKNLSQTNYDLGMRYLNEGNLKEAIFRFKITKKFWPNNYDAHYQLAYCLMINNEFDEAQKIIDELLKKAPHYQERIDQLTGNNN